MTNSENHEWLVSKSVDELKHIVSKCQQIEQELWQKEEAYLQAFRNDGCKGDYYPRLVDANLEEIRGCQKARSNAESALSTKLSRLEQKKYSPPPQPQPQYQPPQPSQNQSQTETESTSDTGSTVIGWIGMIVIALFMIKGCS